MRYESFTSLLVHKPDLPVTKPYVVFRSNSSSPLTGFEISCRVYFVRFCELSAELRQDTEANQQ